MQNKHIKRNYKENTLLPMLDGKTPIVSQTSLTNWRYGSYYSDYCGCSWISIYNASYILKEYTPAPQIISWMESRPFFSGLVLRGALGGYPWTVSKYFKKIGYNTSYGFKNSTILKKSKKSRASIFFYLRRDFTAHFVAFSPTHKPDYYHFYNERQGDLSDIRSLEDFFDNLDCIFKLCIFIG